MTDLTNSSAEESLEAASGKATSGRRAPVFSFEEREALSRRDQAALTKLFDEFFRPVYHYLMRMVGDSSLAEDLSQDVFHNIYRRIETYDPERELQPWIFAIATNLVRSHWRSQGVREKVQSEEDPDAGTLTDELPDNSEPILSVLSETEARDELKQAVLSLPEEMRTAVWLRAYEGLSFEAVAETLSITVAASRKRYSRALARLRTQLGGASA